MRVYFLISGIIFCPGARVEVCEEHLLIAQVRQLPVLRPVRLGCLVHIHPGVPRIDGAVVRSHGEGGSGVVLVASKGEVGLREATGQASFAPISMSFDAISIHFHHLKPSYLPNFRA